MILTRVFTFGSDGRKRDGEGGDVLEVSQLDLPRSGVLVVHTPHYLPEMVHLGLVQSLFVEEPLPIEMKFVYVVLKRS